MRALVLAVVLTACGSASDGPTNGNGNGSAGGESVEVARPVETARALRPDAERLAEALRAACTAVTFAVNDRSRPFRERAERAQAQMAPYQDDVAPMDGDPRLHGAAPDYQLMVEVARDHGVEVSCPAFVEFFRLLESDHPDG